MNNRYKLVIFDLDGTLIDTSEGIFNSVRYAEKCLKLNPISISQLTKFLGPPPKEMYMDLYGLDEIIAIKATQKHREYGYKKGVYQAKLYPNILKIIKNIKNKKYKLAVATLKSQEVAIKILKEYGLNIYFDIIIGMNKEENLTKKLMIKRVMEYVNIFNNQKVIMVGDTINDYIASLETSIDFVGVLYGFGFNNKEIYEFKTISNILELYDIL